MPDDIIDITSCGILRNGEVEYWEMEITDDEYHRAMARTPKVCDNALSFVIKPERELPRYRKKPKKGFNSR